MVSRRTYVAITAMMLVICFLFLLPQYVKETSNPYAVNSYASAQIDRDASTAWHQPEILTSADLQTVDSFMVFIGSADDAVGTAVTAWARMAKQTMLSFGSIAQWSAFGDQQPDAIFIDPHVCNFPADLEQLKAWNEQGITLVFCRLPELSDLRAQYALREFLGIRKLEKANVTLSAIRLFEGFLLGGERIYSVDDPDDAMDLNREVPWVTLRTGTKTYLLGDLPEDVLPGQEYRNEQLPALLWRRARNGSNIFVVNGDYISGNLGVGFLSAIMAEDRAYYLYPVVNAQIFTVASFPTMADENRQAIMERYGKNQAAVMRDLLWPSLESMSEIAGFPMSCFLMPQYHYQDENQPFPELVTYYLKLMKERGAEAGLSMEHNETVTLEDKLTQDTDFLHESIDSYRFCSAYVKEEELDRFRDTAGEEDMLSVSVLPTGEDSLFGYLGQKRLYQNVTHDLLAYSDSQDLKLLSEQTALGYTNALLDMRRVTWPEETEPGWEVYYEKAASILQTHWRVFDHFDRLTVSGSDERIRSFLTMDFREQRTDSTVCLQVDSFDTEAFFILRTHKENIIDVIGGSFRKLEKDAWLIRAEQPEIQIQLELDGLYHS